jgi:sugar lactone lactonase YvrE
VKRRLVFALCAFALSTCAATSTAWEITGYSEFLKGRLSGLSLTADGVLQLGPALRFNTNLEQPALWSVAAAPDGSIYASTGHRGKVFRISPDGKSALAWTAEQSQVFAVCVDAKGVLYAGSSPNGGVYRIERGQAKEIWHSAAKYIWALQSAPDGTLYVATGEQGRIYRIDPNANAEVYFETRQSNVTALAVSLKGRLYAGTEPNGLLYEISAPKQGTILLDSALPEIRALAIDPNGAVYAAAMGGSVASRTKAPPTPTTTTSTGTVVATTPTVITVTEAKQSGTPSEGEQNPGGVKPGPEQPRGTVTSTVTPAAPTTTGVVEVSGVDKSAIYRIAVDRTIETLRSSKEDNVYDLLLDGDALIFSTDVHGRIYRLTDKRATLLAEPGDGETTRILKSGSVLYAGLSSPARLFAFDTASAGEGSYESQVHDSTTVARWGHLQWHGTGSGIVFKTRTGNAARPDATWSAWSAPISNAEDALIKSPQGRFIQWRAEWPSRSTAQINTVDVPYLSQNTPPVIHSVSVSSITGTNTAKAASTTASSSSAYSVTVTDTGDTPATSSSTTPSQTVSRLQTTQTQVSWQADDPDGDKLVYSLYFRAEDATAWQLIRSRMFENTLLLDPDVFADGRYLFRIVASDAPANAAQYARETEFVSTPVLIDNTPPLITPGAPRRDGTSLDIDVDANDKTSPLRRCEYSLDAGLWQPIEAVDGITDSPHEQFHLHLDRLRPGEHLLVFRVYDSANNAGLAKIVLH